MNLAIGGFMKMLKLVLIAGLICGSAGFASADEDDETQDRTQPEIALTPDANSVEMNSPSFEIHHGGRGWGPGWGPGHHHRHPHPGRGYPNYPGYPRYPQPPIPPRYPVPPRYPRYPGYPGYPQPAPRPAYYSCTVTVGGYNFTGTGYSQMEALQSAQQQCDYNTRYGYACYNAYSYCQLY